MIEKHSSQQHSVQKEFSSDIVETSEKKVKTMERVIIFQYSPTNCGHACQVHH